jgi:tetratricopeptide (TPR) repeat protein
LAGHNDGLCVITTRIAVHELSDRKSPAIISHDLQNLALEDGINLLKSLGVHGGEAYQSEYDQLKDAVSEYKCHALAIHLLGNAVYTYLDGNVLKRNSLDELIDDDDIGIDDISRHARKVMQAYQKWLTDEDGNPTPELQLLYLLGLFDHPVEIEVLKVLWQAQISGLTEGILEKKWQVAIRDLRDKHHLLSTHEGMPDLLDCHPLIREYFGKQLRKKQPNVWKKAHKKLYKYYKALPNKKFPDTLEEMQPLFNAVSHGCAAGLYQQVLDEVYYPRIRREKEAYIVKQLGSFSDDLAVLAHFFVIPWCTTPSFLTEHWQSEVFNWTGFDLHSLGRLYEALALMEENIKIDVKLENWKEAAIGVNNISELQLALGCIGDAKVNGKCSFEYADKSRDLFECMSDRTTYADVLHQAGEIDAAVALYEEAEEIQQKREPELPQLYSLWGFRYCDLLLTQKKVTDVIDRGRYALNISVDNNGKGGMGLLDIALDKLTLGCAYKQQGDFLLAADLLDQAVFGLRASGYQNYLLSSLLARSAVYRCVEDFPNARKYLQEVYDIAQPSGMRLHLTDYNLEMARLLLAEINSDIVPNNKRTDYRGKLQKHVDDAAKLIATTGYHRRDAELNDLQQKSS